VYFEQVHPQYSHFPLLADTFYKQCVVGFIMLASKNVHVVYFSPLYLLASFPTPTRPPDHPFPYSRPIIITTITTIILGPGSTNEQEMAF
jgi:hypothetical protein